MFSVLGLDKRDVDLSDDQPSLSGRTFDEDSSRGSLPPLDTSLANQFQRECATVVCESGSDFGTFTVSYDAPSPRALRLSLSRESSSPQSSSAEQTSRPPLEDTVPVASKRCAPELSLALEPEPVSVPAAVAAPPRRRIQPAIPRPIASATKKSNLQVARSVGDVSKLHTAAESDAQIHRRHLIDIGRGQIQLYLLPSFVFFFMGGKFIFMYVGGL